MSTPELCELCDRLPVEFKCTQCQLSGIAEYLCSECCTEAHLTGKAKLHTPISISGSGNSTNKEAAVASTPPASPTPPNNTDVHYVSSFSICTNCEDLPSTYHCAECNENY